MFDAILACHEPQPLKGRGLHLNRVPAAAGVVRHHREHDISPITDIESGIDISKGHMSTQYATEGCLIGPVAFVAAAADVAGSAAVPGINQGHRHAFKRSLVADKLTQLPKGPVAVPCSLRMLNRCALAYMRQLFQRYSAYAAFGFRNKSLADDVVRVALETALPAAQFLQSPLGASCADRLKCLPPLAIPLATLLYWLPTVDFSVAIGSKVDNAKIDTQHAINLIRCWLIRNADREQIPPALAVDQIAFTLPRLQQQHLAGTSNKGKCLASRYSPDRNRLFVGLKGENAVIVGNTAMLGVGSLSLTIQFVAIGNFGKATNSQLCRQAVLSPNAVVDHFLKIVLAKGLPIPGHAADVIARGIRLFKCTTQRISLFRVRKEFDLGYNLHLVSIPYGDGMCHTNRSGIGCPLGALGLKPRGFLPTVT